MSPVKKQHVNTCVSLLKEYINTSPDNEGKGTAVLALEQLQKVTAGNGVYTDSDNNNCNGRPRANGS